MADVEKLGRKLAVWTLIAGSLLLVALIFQDSIKEFTSTLPHLFKEHKYELVDKIDDFSLVEKLDQAIPRGSFGVGDLNFYYASMHDVGHDRYIYQFRNSGGKDMVVKSKALLPLMGRLKLLLPAGETRYLIVDNNKPPREFHYGFYIYNKGSILQSEGTGTTVELIMPSDE